MSVTFRLLGGLTVAVLIMLAPATMAGGAVKDSSTQVKPKVGPPGMPSSTTGAIYSPPAGSNPYSGPSVATPPPTSGGGSPYALSTQPGYNPYVGASPPPSFVSQYQITQQQQTTPPFAYGAGMGGFGGYGLSTFPGFPLVGAGYGNSVGGALAGYGSALQGFSSTIAATGQYEKDIQTARIIREQSRQAILDTRRREIEYQIWYEQVRPKTRDILAAERTGALEQARIESSEVDILSGSALNTLLSSIRKMGSLSRVSSPALDEETLKHINVSGGSSSGNVGMLKDGLKINWPEGLSSEGFDEPRKRLTRNLRAAVDMLKDREPVPATMLKDIRSDYKAIKDKLDENVNDLSFDESIKATRFLKSLDGAIKALSDPQVQKYFNNTWNAKGKNVAELTDHLTKEGLNFAPATPGDEAAYRALYYAMRSYEASMQTAQR